MDKTLLQNFATFSFLQNFHLLNCNLVQFDQAFFLRNLFINKHSIQIFHIRLNKVKALSPVNPSNSRGLKI